jgi:hypothetical protein
MNSNKEIRLISKIVILLLICTCMYVCYYSIQAKALFYMQTKYDSKGIYIWGDSREYQAIDVNLLRTASGRNVYSYSSHGAGSYDFLIFSNNVPRNSTVLLGLSEAMFLRDLKMDDNSSGLIFSELLKLILNGYDAKNIARIIMRNREGSNHFTKNPAPLPFKAEINLYQWNIYMDIYRSKDRIKIFNMKQKLFYEGMKELKIKNCKVKIIIFPMSELLKAEYEKSIYFSMMNDQYSKYSKLGFRVYFPVGIISKSNIMYDESHFNVNGRTLMTNYVLKYILD